MGLQPFTGYTDGTVTFVKPVDFYKDVSVTGSFIIDGSLIASGSGAIGFSPNTRNAIFGSLGMIDAPMSFSRSVSTDYQVLLSYTEGIGLGIRNGNVVIARQADDAFLNNFDNESNLLIGRFGGQSFQSGSDNISINTGGSTFKSGSSNIFLHNSLGALETGSNNVIIGSYERGNSEENNLMSLGSNTHAYIEGTGNNLIHMKDDVFVSGALTVSGSATITGSVQGNVNSLSISSNTSSLNLNDGNFFTLQLVSGSDTRIEPSNIKPGQTINIELSTTGSATVSFPSSVKQVSGSLYVPTTTTSKDIITLVSFDSSNLYLANVKNLV
jgi:hypothetical protein